MGQERRRRRLCRKKKRTNRLISISSPKSPPLGFFLASTPRGAKKRLAVLRFWDSLCNSERARVQRQGKTMGKGAREDAGKGFSEDALPVRGDAHKAARRETRPRQHPRTRREAAVDFGVGCSPHRAGRCAPGRHCPSCPGLGRFQPKLR